MKAIMEVYGILIMLLLTVQTGLVETAATEKVGQAKQFKAETVSEIENSNFNPVVINACIAGAAQAGYELTVTLCSYDENNDIQMAEVELAYTYSIPMLGINETRVTRGVAR